MILKKEINRTNYKVFEYESDTLSSLELVLDYICRILNNASFDLSTISLTDYQERNEDRNKSTRIVLPVSHDYFRRCVYDVNPSNISLSGTFNGTLLSISFDMENYSFCITVDKNKQIIIENVENILKRELQWLNRKEEKKMKNRQLMIDDFILMNIEDILKEYEEKDEHVKNIIGKYTASEYDILLEYLLADVSESDFLDIVNRYIKEIINARLSGIK